MLKTEKNIILNSFRKKVLAFFESEMRKKTLNELENLFSHHDEFP
jgi:hypothetical protein